VALKEGGFDELPPNAGLVESPEFPLAEGDTDAGCSELAEKPPPGELDEPELGVDPDPL
jgi:hypothetical protein